MEDIKNRLITAIIDYGNSNAASDFDAEDMANYLIETIYELHFEPIDARSNLLDVIIDTYNNLMICPHCRESISDAYDWTPKFCKECGNPLTGGNQESIE